MIIKQINATRLKLPLKDITKDACKTRSNAKPAKVEINAGGVASISLVNRDAYSPNKIAKKQIIKAATYC